MSAHADRVSEVIAADRRVAALPQHRAKSAAPEALDPCGDPVARAEAALAALSNEFASWMAAECDRLEQARRRARRSGLSGASAQELFRCAHDIKGSAATYRFPHAASVAASLCRLLEYRTGAPLPFDLIERHVDAIRAIVREADVPGAHAVAAELATRLEEVTAAFVGRENGDPSPG
jgi:HPt (histidine-containing phosphotransfer) domain-containing protein